MSSILSIVTPAASTALTTLEHVKEELPQVSGTGDDSYLTRKLAEASSLIAGQCGRALGSQTVADTFRNKCRRRDDPLILSLPFVSSVTSITEDGGSPLVEDTDFEIDAEGGLVWRLYNGVRCTWSASVIVVTYVAGWQLPGDGPTAGVPPLPPEIEGACIALVAGAYNDRGRDIGVISDQQEGVGTVRYAQRQTVGTMQMDDGLAATLRRYTVRGV